MAGSPSQALIVRTSFFRKALQAEKARKFVLFRCVRSSKTRFLKNVFTVRTKAIRSVQVSSSLCVHLRVVYPHAQRVRRARNYDSSYWPAVGSRSSVSPLASAAATASINRLTRRVLVGATRTSFAEFYSFLTVNFIRRHEVTENYFGSSA